jgi:hypothetical protein
VFTRRVETTIDGALDAVAAIGVLATDHAHGFGRGFQANGQLF